MKITIYGADWCSACKKAKVFCTQKNIEHEFFDISEDKEALLQIKSIFGKEPKSIPQIFDGDTLIGGYTDLVQYINK